MRMALIEHDGTPFMVDAATADAFEAASTREERTAVLFFRRKTGRVVQLSIAA